MCRKNPQQLVGRREKPTLYIQIKDTNETKLTEGEENKTK